MFADLTFQDLNCQVQSRKNIISDRFCTIVMILNLERDLDALLVFFRPYFDIRNCLIAENASAGC